MDIMKQVLASTGSTNGVPESTYTPPQSAQPPAPRTKIVFVYSDEEAEGDVPTGASGMRARTVDCTAHAVPISADNLAELEEEATRFRGETEKREESPELDFREDLSAGLGTLSAADSALLETIQQERGAHMRACVVTAPTIRDGVYGDRSAQAASHEEELRPLRHHLDRAAFASALAQPGYKRFRVDEATAVATAEVVVDVEEALGSRLKPVISEDGAVRAVETAVGGYRLTVDEGELLESADADMAAEGPGLRHAGVVIGDEAEAAPMDGEAPDADEVAETMADFDFGFDDDDYDEDGEEEEELDDAIVVAVAAQLLQCCEAEDLDPSMNREAARFASIAAPLLARLRAYEAAHPDIDVISDDDKDDDKDDVKDDVKDDAKDDVKDDAPDSTPAPAQEAARLATTHTGAPAPVVEVESSTAEVTQDVGSAAPPDNSPLSPSAFAQQIDYHIRRFQRVFRSVYRPRDEPIVIDGVRMDL